VNVIKAFQLVLMLYRSQQEGGFDDSGGSFTSLGQDGFATDPFAGEDPFKGGERFKFSKACFTLRLSL
jgi:hypothetical protein